MVEQFIYKENEKEKASFILKTADDTLRDMIPILERPVRTGILHSIDFVAWGTTGALHDLDIYAIKPGLTRATGIKSPILNEVRNFGAEDNWFDFFDSMYEFARNEGIGEFLDVKRGNIAASLESIYEKTGIGSEVAINHSPFLLRWALKNSLQGATIAAFDFGKHPDDREFMVWHSDLNNVRKDREIQEMIESISDVDFEDIYAPVYSSY